LDNQEKIISLFNYIKELSALKYSIVSDINKQYWTCFLDDIPNDPENISIYYRDRVENDSNDNMVLLEVRKPDFQRCPPPPAIVINWLEPGWDKYSNDVKYKEYLNIDKNTESSLMDADDGEIEYFDDSIDRTKAYAIWIFTRNKWAEKQLVINDTRRFFTRLFQAYTDLERDSETLEFMVGNGLLQDSNSQNINHPVLLKRVKFDFDANNNTIIISDSDSDPELYTLMLQGLQDINYSAVRQLKEDLRENFYHPLDRHDTIDFLKVLTHRLSSESRFIIDKDEKQNREDKFVTRSLPVYFIRKRIDGTLKAIEEIITNIDNTGYIPGHLLDLVGSGIIEVPEDNPERTIDELLAAASGENIDILLSKEANHEQLEIAERIEHYNAVLVQGPPGTGKTHTIANLLGHFLAQGKSVLVTSHTKKALSVLKSKVSEAVQDLCVSILDDTNIDMIRSIDGISDYLSQYTSNMLMTKVNSSERQRKEIIKHLSDIRRKIYTIKNREYTPIVYNGINFSPAKAAEFVSANTEALSYIPGVVTLNHPLPVNTNELHLLYRSNEGLSVEDEVELACDIPSPELLQSPIIFSDDILRENMYENSLNQLEEILFLKFKFDYPNDSVVVERLSKPYVLLKKPNRQALDNLRQHIASFGLIDKWMIQAAVDGKKGGGFRQKWELLIDLIEQTSSHAESIIVSMIGKSITIPDDSNLSQLKSLMHKIAEIFQKKGKLSKIDLLFNKQLEKVLAEAVINGKPIASYEDCIAVIGYIELLEKRKETEILWDENIAKHGSPSFSELGHEPEDACKYRIPNIKRYIDWYENEHTVLLSLIEKAGFDAGIIFDFSDLDTLLSRTEKVLSAVQEKIPHHLKVADIYLNLQEIRHRRVNSALILNEGKRKASNSCVEMIGSICNLDTTRYEENYYKISSLFEKYALQKMRVEILEKIKVVAPGWTAALIARDGIHGETKCPDSIQEAWKWKQFAGIIEEITAEPFEELQKKAAKYSKDLREKTAELASFKAWHHLIKRTEHDIEMRQALMGWKLTVKRIGKGTGKNAPALKKQARALMAKCQTAVPAWIMPVSKAMETLDASKNQFDIVIIDEASQSDLSALAILYMAKKAIIVGDDKQVSPMGIGVEIDRINALREMHIKDKFPNWHLYDVKSSLYDIAGTTYQPLMLREHFRCVPDIIGYSNKLSYDFKIKPLRDASSSTISPSILQFRVLNGQREGKKKINHQEAVAIVSIMIACMEQPEYEKESFGVISLLGEDQVELIRKLIFKRIDPAIIEKRRILWGDASQFQGDERGVIFLSLVDSNQGDGPLRKTGEGADQSIKQRYNVAASRARNQLWVMHSLDYSQDLQNEDLRKDLIEYANDPKAFSQVVEQIEAQSDSPFEENVAKMLVAAGYQITQQWKVGAYRIDMVAQYNGNKIAIECDGEQYHSGEEKIRADMERQTILERLGWKFIRIRGSEYYRDPENTISRVISELKNYGIYQQGTPVMSSNQNDSELFSRVIIRAAQIMDEWEAEEDSGGTDPDEIDIKKQDRIVTTVQPILNCSNPSEKSIGTQSPINPPCSDNVNINENRKSEINEPDQHITESNPPQKHKANKKGSRNSVNSNKFVKIDSSTHSDIVHEGIIHKLEDAGICYIDKREQSGIIWVPFSFEIKDKLEDLVAVSSEYKMGFEPRGSLSTENKPAWRIMMK